MCLTTPRLERRWARLPSLHYLAMCRSLKFIEGCGGPAAPLIVIIHRPSSHQNSVRTRNHDSTPTHGYQILSFYCMY
jgi:hypothetical protein